MRFIARILAALLICFNGLGFAADGLTLAGVSTSAGPPPCTPVVPWTISQASDIAATGSGITWTITGASYGTASAGRLIVQTIYWVGTLADLASATIGGVPAIITKAPAVSNSNRYTPAILSAIVPTGTSGNTVLTFSTGPTSTGLWTGYSSTGIPSSTPFDSGNTATGSVASASVSLNVVGCGFVVAAVGFNASPATSIDFISGVVTDHAYVLTTLPRIQGGSSDGFYTQPITVTSASVGNLQNGLVAASFSP